MNQEKLDELAARRAARPDLDWDAVDAWIARSLSPIRAGGVLSLVLPDGKSFTARKVGPAPRRAEHGT